MLVFNCDSFNASKVNAVNTFFSATTEFVNPQHDLMDLFLIMIIMHDEDQLCKKPEGQHDSWITSCFWAATSKNELVAGDGDSDFCKDHRGIQRC